MRNAQGAAKIGTRFRKFFVTKFNVIRRLLRRISIELRRALLKTAGLIRRYFLLILGLALAGLSIFTVTNVPVRVDAADAIPTLISMAEILTTIFATSMSLLLVGLQVVSERYSARVLRAVLYDPVVIGYIILYAVSIFVVTRVCSHTLEWSSLLAGSRSSQESFDELAVTCLAEKLSFFNYDPTP